MMSILYNTLLSCYIYLPWLKYKLTSNFIVLVFTIRYPILQRMDLNVAWCFNSLYICNKEKRPCRQQYQECSGVYTVVQQELSTKENT